MAHLVKSQGLDALKTDPFVDITVACRDKEWKVHKTYLCGGSQAMVKHCLSMKEATEGRVYFSLDEPAAVERLLKFQYISSYCDTDILPSPISGIFAQRSLKSRYGPPFGSFTFSGGSRGPFPTSTLGRYDPVDKTDRVNNAPPWTVQTYMQTPIPTFGVPDVGRATDEIFEKATKGQITSVFQLNVQMYALAQRFDLEDLKTQSLEKIKCKEHYLRYCFLDRVLDTVYELTSPDDADLRSWLFQRCVANYMIVELMPGAVQKLSEHDVKVAGPDRHCAWTFEVAKQTFDEAKRGYEAQIRANEVELAKSRADFAESDTRRDEEVADLKTKLKEAKEKIGPQMGANGRKKREIEALQQQNHALQQEVEASQRQVHFLRQVSGYRGPL